MNQVTVCDLCNAELHIGDFPFCGGDPSKHVPAAAAVIGDDIPGGEIVDHLFPTPRKFYSKTEIKRACNEGAWTRKGDTPVPYRVSWSGRRNDGRHDRD